MPRFNWNDYLHYNHGNSSDSDYDYYIPSRVSTEDEEEEEKEENNSADLVLDLEKLNLSAPPTKKLLVFCLGGLLVQRVWITGRMNKPDFRQRADHVHRNFLIFKRPFCDEFLQFCFQRFEVGIWSSANVDNIKGMIKALGDEISSRFAFIWDQDYCTNTGYESLENERQTIFLKKLKRIWRNRYSMNRSWPKGTYSSANTLLIDTEPCKALLNPADTGIFLDEYKFEKNEQDTYLGPEGPLRVFLDGLKDAEDVTSYVKENRIGQPEIQPSHPDWSFYKKVIDRLS